MKRLFDKLVQWMKSLVQQSVDEANKEAHAWVDKEMEDTKEYINKQKAELKQEMLERINEELNECASEYAEKWHIPNFVVSGLVEKLGELASEYYDLLSQKTEKYEETVVNSTGSYLHSLVDKIIKRMKGE